MDNCYRDVFDDLGWNVTEYGDYIEIQKYSPAGEDFLITISKDNFVDELVNYYNNFEPEDHAADFYIAGRNGLIKGVPNLHVLLQDADEIDKMLELLIIKLFEIKIKHY